MGEGKKLKIKSDSERLFIPGLEFWILSFFFIFTLFLRLQILFSNPHAWGADGYYYAAQMKHIYMRGYFFSMDSSLVLKYLLLFTKFSNDYVFTNKIAIGIISSLIVFPAYLVGSQIGGRKGGLFFAAFCAG